jgi:hypothetical protein
MMIAAGRDAIVMPAMNEPHRPPPRPLDYPSPPASPYDRPVEQTLRLVGQLRVVFGVLLGAGVLAGIAFVLWVLSRLM